LTGETKENQAQSGTLSTLDKPKRWDLPFSQDLPNEAERRDLTETELDRLLQSKPFSAMDLDKFPKSLAVRDILRNDTRIRKYRSGDAVVSVGDYGNSAFLILEGRLTPYLSFKDCLFEIYFFLRVAKSISRCCFNGSILI